MGGEEEEGGKRGGRGVEEGRRAKRWRGKKSETERRDEKEAEMGGGGFSHTDMTTHTHIHTLLH